MKNNFIKRSFYAFFALLVTFGFEACTVHNHKTVVVKKKHLPPGQAKKIYGDKSAKKHAPGHNK